MLDGVFREAEAGGLEFHPAPGPSDDEVAAIPARIRARVGRVLRRRGLAPEDAATGPVDRLSEESPLLAGLVSASVQGRVALGARAGRRVRRVGEEADAEGMMSRGPRQAHLDGFDLHANVWVGANDRAGLERLCRYILRPPFAQERLRVRGDGRVGLELKRAWHSLARRHARAGVRVAGVPGRLAALTPRPETNLLICHGLLASRARWRGRVVAYGRVEREPTASAAPMVRGPDGVGEKSPARGWTWAALMQRAFALDVLVGPHCGGRLRLIATLHDPAVIRKILAHLGRSPSEQSPGPRRRHPEPIIVSRGGRRRAGAARRPPC